MPRDSGGVMSRTNGVFQGPTTWQQQQQSVDKRIVASQQDVHDEDLAQEITDSLSRDGKGGMRSNLDAGGFRVTNIGAPVNGTDAIRRGDSFQLEAFQTIAGKSTVPFNVPSWAREITMMFRTIQTAGTAIPEVQLGTSGGYVTAGYSGSVGRIVGASAALLSSGFSLVQIGSSSSVLDGHMTFSYFGGNVWTAGSNIGNSDVGQVSFMGGSIDIAGVLTQIRLNATATTFVGAGGVGLIIKG